MLQHGSLRTAGRVRLCGHHGGLPRVVPLGGLAGGALHGRALRVASVAAWVDRGRGLVNNKGRHVAYNALTGTRCVRAGASSSWFTKQKQSLRLVVTFQSR